MPLPAVRSKAGRGRAGGEAVCPLTEVASITTTSVSVSQIHKNLLKSMVPTYS
jgi:hypothetical protein